jgi:chemotaxis protein methyltransferase CheR
MSASSPALAGGPDLRLSSDRYHAVGEFLHEITGIRLRDGKEALVVSRLGHRVRATGLASLDSYIDAILDGDWDEELPHFIDVLTTNKTNFFREAAHFDLLAERVLPRLAAQGREIRLWSAACSSGEEPYTLAMTVRDHLPPEAQRRTRILATDISTRILATARTARYSGAQLHGLTPEVLRRHLDREPGASGAYTVKPEVREFVRFARLNLMDAWPMRGPFDVILCRNVMIYFDRPTQEVLVQRFAELLPPGGYLCVGHAESLSGIAHGLEVVQPAVYRKPERGA